MAEKCYQRSLDNPKIVNNKMVYLLDEYTIF